MNTNLSNTGRRLILTRNQGLIIGVLLVGTLGLPSLTEAGPPQPKEHTRYKLIDLGTLGGPSSGVAEAAQVLNNQGLVSGGADTGNLDPFDPLCFAESCFVVHAFQWQNGVLADLGTLPGGASSFANWVNDSGASAGASQNGLVDPLTGIPEQVAVLWHHGEIINLGTFGGAFSQANAINNRGEVIGFAQNAILDDFSLVGLATQTRAFLWDKGVLSDLGTLGGPDAFAQYINERGQIAGFSYVDSTPTDTTGVPAVHAFLWEDGGMLDLGSLGGNWAEVSNLNNRGQITGFMNLPGDESHHPFLWERGTLRDLGTFGGSNGGAAWLNDAGGVVGTADLPGDLLHNAFLWRNGVMTDLGNLGITSAGKFINSKGQVVGASRVSRVPSQASAFIWENGGPMIDLNTLVPANSPLHLVSADCINDRGEITGIAVPAGVSSDDTETLGHAFLLIPVHAE